MKLSVALINRYAQGGEPVLVYNLAKLHRLWYEINLLKTKFSGMAEDRGLELSSEFYILAKEIINEITSGYKDWVYNHEGEGWWDRIKEELISFNGTLPTWDIDISSLVAEDVFYKFLELNDEVSWDHVISSTGNTFKSIKFLNMIGVTNFNEADMFDAYD